jgi:hypothetical protein
MATTGYRDASNNDLSTIFDIYVSGTQANLTGYLDLSGNDLSTRFVPYVSGTQATATGYKLANGNDISNVFAPKPDPVPNFGTETTAFPGGAGNYQSVSMDGSNCVFSTQGGNAAGDARAYLYWSDNFGGTLNKATISGSEQQFWGCVAISGDNAVAMGKVGTTAATARFYLSTNRGKSYTVASTTGATASTLGGVKIALSGTKSIWSAWDTPTYYSNLNFSNNTATWTSVGVAGNNVDVSMFGTNAYSCCSSNTASLTNGFQYSTNSGATFTKNANIPTTVEPRNCIQVGTNIYVAGRVTATGATVIYKITGGNPASAPTNTFTSPGGSSGFIVALAGCPRISGDDFVMFWTGGNGPYYSNNGGTSFVLASPTVNFYPQAASANSTRIIMGSQNTGIFWGRNAYIT